MIRHTLERDWPVIENPQLRVHAGGGVSRLPRRRTATRRAVATHSAGNDPGPARGASAAIEVADLWSDYLAAPTRPVRDRLVIHYASLVYAVAHRLAVGLPSYVDTADLAQCGMFGLLAAIERFDPQRCPRFESYAAQRIRGAILDELRAQDWVPRTVRGRVKDRERAQERLEGRLLRAVSDQELADELGTSVREIRAHAQPVQLLSVEALDEASGGVSEFFVDTTADPMAVVQDRETVRQLRVAVDRLAERDRTVIHRYYLENRTLAEIGRELGLTESRVCQLHARAVVRLRGHLDDLAG